MQEIFVEIFNFINELVSWVNPQKKIFLGFDGPAPRAKQNQQRSRRFKSA
jgi:5'-3' exonuclease